MTTLELTYTEIERLVKGFKTLPAAQRKGMNEMQTRLGYILPLFKALGCDTTNINEVSPEEKVSRGWVDFSFRIGNTPRFFLETKKVNEDLNDPRWVKQAINYAWTKSVTWALLSDSRRLDAEAEKVGKKVNRQAVRPEDDLDRARQLDRQIAKVDAEIDGKVYALYGLTDEEIKIVEG